MTTSPPTCASSTMRDQLLSGDPHALDDLFRCSKEALTRYLRSRCGDTADAEDALQTAFENAHRFLEGYRGESSPRTWLFRVAANACSRMRRGRKNDPKLHVALDEEHTAAPAPFLDRVDAVFGAIAELDPLDRAVLLLRDGEGRSAREAAAALGLTESALKSRLFRARRHVRDVADA